MFGRRQRFPVAPGSGGDTGEPAESPPAGGKGRPTPKRSEAERDRRLRARGPQDRRAKGQLRQNRSTAQRRDRGTQRRDRAAQRRAEREGMSRGDERYLPKRDKGPARRFVRDFIDSRFTVAEFFLPAAATVLALSLVPSTPLRLLANLVWLAMIASITVDSIIVSRRLRNRLAARFPDHPRRGTFGYAMLRALTYRRFRTPAPQVSRGAQV